ncbi:Methyltransferase domain-containing protein [Microbulbifer donghaiensis]|uniref:Methyltransferase domain-containing protein n=1 Tax=Microbulbifer donghaiensis TaxID=494016 RepID=A0A1M5FJZ1_9GAMM|nr:class I SAM-dependent methyltransferase [Microbulbifer donghaiensis]SHF91927.1 Methyltransferase domain-containing protein [Microbulbifer donghaiensis]
MSFYEDRCLPHLINCACGLKAFRKQRQLVVPQARGRVLEVGFGSGLNLPFYDRARVEFIWGLEPSAGMRKRARDNVSKSPLEVRWLDLPSEEIPLEDNSVDTILLTYTLCTIPDWRRALGEMRRVLKPGGQLIFSEHGRAPDADVRKWQDRLNPYWRRAFGGCNLNRAIPELIEKSGFSVLSLESGYILSPKLAGFNYWGSATSV